MLIPRPQALATLATATVYVKFFEGEVLIGRIPPAEAITRLARGAVAGGSKTRIRYIRADGDVRRFPDNPHHWDDRAVLRYWPDDESRRGVKMA